MRLHPLLIRVLAVAVCGALSPPWAGAADDAVTLRVGGTGAALGTVSKLSEHYTQAVIETVPSLGSRGGVRALEAGALDIALTARTLSPEEAGPGLRVHAFALTPVAFAVHPQLEITDVTLEQIASIYQGTLTHWPEGTPVRLVTRPRSEAITRMLSARSPKLALALEASYRRPGQILASTDQQAAELVETSQGAITPLALAQIMSEGRALRVLALDGVSPSAQALAQGAYPYGMTLYMVTREPMSAPVRAFIAYAYSPAAQKLLRELEQWPLAAEQDGRAPR